MVPKKETLMRGLQHDVCSFVSNITIIINDIQNIKRRLKAHRAVHG